MAKTSTIAFPRWRPCVVPCVAFALFSALSQAALAQEKSGLHWVAVAPGKPVLLLVPTMHVLVEEDLQVNRALGALMSRASALALELPLQPRSQEDIQPYLKYGLYRNDDNLLRHVAPSDVPLMRKCAAEAGVSFEKFVHAKPWFNTGHIYTLSRPGKSAYPGIDWRLQKIAQAQQKPILYLESVEDSAKEWDGITQEAQISMLKYACHILDGSVTNDFVLKAQHAWRDGDAAVLATLADSPVPGQPPELFDMSLYIYRFGTDRFFNGLMRDDISHVAGPILVAVGFGHFFGEASLVERLTKAGYTVTGPTTIP